MPQRLKDHTTSHLFEEFIEAHMEKAMNGGERRLTIFLVEDEPGLMFILEESVKALGYEVTQKAEDLSEALGCVTQGEFDMAMLDVSLHGQDSFPVADELMRLGIPFVFTTGFGAARLPDRFKGAPLMEKPFRLKDLSNALQALAPCP
ncbi:response regulator [Paracidovorax citrulli]